MATHAIGKFKFNLSDQGLAYRWGDGTVHRLFQGKKKAAADDEYLDNPEVGEDYDAQDAYDAQDGDYDGDPGYADDYDEDDGYADDDYEDGGDYAEDDFPEDDYADDGDYAGDGYGDDGDYADDDYADDGDFADDDYTDDGDYADDGYDDGGYGDDGDYNDRYSDQDAGDYGEYESEQSSLMRYVEENDWVTYLLLFLLPPLGIYLLWRRNRFEKPIRWAVTAASAIWFIVALILLLRGLFGGTGDTQAQPNITIPPVTAEATQQPEGVTSIDLGGGNATVAPEDSGADEGADVGTDVGGDDGAADAGTEVQPSPTPLSGSGSGTGTETAVFVYSPATGLYYHATDTCPSIGEGVTTTRVTREIAENSRHQSPCPDCIGGGTTTTYYATVGGKYYHSDSRCSNMRNPLVYTKEAAESQGKSPCPVCILKTQESLDQTDDVGTVFIDSNTRDQSGVEVYATKDGTYFHVKSDCSGMKNATKGALRDALLAGKKACPTCCAAAGELVYCTSGGKSYHVDKNCQGMTKAKQITRAEAMVMGKTKCDVCMKGSSGGDAASAGGDGDGNTVSLTTASGDVKVYATKNGTYYHTRSNCSGMKDAQLYSLKSMILAGKKACPTCASAANTTVYATKGGKYYHSYATCSGMTGAASGTLADALAAGYKRCPKCWGSNNNATQTASAQQQQQQRQAAAQAQQNGGNETTTTNTRQSTAASKATASNTYVYATRSGAYYHLKSSCSGMTDASRVTLKTAINAGKKPCPTCASAAKRTVYSTKNGDHYHVASVCAPSGMKNGKKRTLAEALMLNQTACPYCLSSKARAEAAQAAAAQYQAAVQAAGAVAQQGSTTYRSGKSGIRVYASVTGKYYHTKSNRPNMTGSPSRVTLETALNYGKKACPDCAGAASRKVYATKGGKYYHYSKSDAGSGAKQGTLASALAYGLDPCPNCVRKLEQAREAAQNAEDTYTVGTSGIKVYATLGSKYYHSKKDCSGLTGASKIALETALNYGKKACPICLSSASRKVYATPGGKYYHYSKAHAGSGATAGTLAEARAYGMKACPLCTVLSPGSNEYDNGGAEDAPVSQEEYGAASDSNVYIDIGSANNYYHKSAKCKDAGFSGGTKVTLQYVLDWDYKACPYCKPPTYAIVDSTEA